ITFNKYLGKKYTLAIKLDDRIYRLLAKYKKDKDSKVVMLRDDISNNGMDKKKDISNTEKECTEKKKELYRGSLNNYDGHKQDMNNKYSKFVTKKYRSPLLLFLLLSTLLIVDISLCSSSGEKGFCELLNLDTTLSSWKTILKNHFSWLLIGTKTTTNAVLGNLFNIVLYVIPFLILGVTLISYVFYYHKKAKKYEKIKFSKK
ncbi:Plasmodium exported protein (Pm-fam-a like), unknown function, partial [Plasmodium malariae]